MKLSFVTTARLPFGVDTPNQIPLGGSESALCYLTRELAILGHHVTVYSPHSLVQTIHQVHHAPLRSLLHQPPSLVVIQNQASLGPYYRRRLSPKTKLILWTQHDVDQPAMESLALPRVRQAFTGFIFVSHWQQTHYLRTFPLDQNRCTILKNAIAPAFASLFDSTGSILTHKTQPPVIVYASTPYRGLSRLLDIFPHLKNNFPSLTLNVFSSMSVYQVDLHQDELDYGALYQRCRSTPGVHYYGSIPQPQLAQTFKSALALVYPNTFAETSCIAALEAMAAGCRIITTDLGALPETTAGFADLIDHALTPTDYEHAFTAAISHLLTNFTQHSAQLESALQDQVSYIHLTQTWSLRAHQWQMILPKLVKSP